jgi:hypothetical protein
VTQTSDTAIAGGRNRPFSAADQALAVLVHAATHPAHARHWRVNGVEGVKVQTAEGAPWRLVPEARFLHAPTVRDGSLLTPGPSEALLRFAQSTLYVVNTLIALRPRSIIASTSTRQLIEMVKRLDGMHSLDVKVRDAADFPLPGGGHNTASISRLAGMASRNNFCGPLAVINDAGSQARLKAFGELEQISDFDVRFVDFGDHGTPWKRNNMTMGIDERGRSEIQDFVRQLANNMTHESLLPFFEPSSNTSPKQQMAPDLN